MNYIRSVFSKNKDTDNIKNINEEGQSDVQIDK